MNDNLCKGCGEPLTGMRADAVFHGETCRSRYRHGGEDRARKAFWGRLRDITRTRPSARPTARQSPVNEDAGA